MAFGTASDPLLAAAIWIGAGAVGASALMLAATALLRLRLMARTERERRFAALWQPLLAVCAEGGDADYPRLAAEDGPLFLRLWVHAQESLRGAAQSRLVRLAEELRADHLAVEFLGTGKPRLELLGLVAVGHLRLRGILPLAQALARSESPAISLAAAHALLRIDAARELPLVVELAARREDWPLSRLAATFRECADESLDAVFSAALDAASSAQDGGLARLLRLVGAVRPETARDAVLRVLARARGPEAVGAALDALWHPADAQFARRYAGHALWSVRLAAVKALARIGTIEDRALLEQLLSDESWWVRYRAAQALARLPGVGLADLEQLRRACGDRFAADMLGQVIAERERA